ncbi:MAG: stage II sporulation protein M, partial [Anaerolineales bacterium]|nr:stage II sporulation protein M [Anaerolineales bacterium]
MTLSRALIVTRRELRDQLRDWRIISPMVVLTLFFPLLMNFTADRMLDFVKQYGANILGERLIPFLLMVVGFFPISVSLVIALESFVGEKERHSLEPLLASPLTDTELYVGKILASTLPPLLSSYLGIFVYLVGLALTVGWFAEPTLLIQILALTAVHGLVMVAGAVVVSSQATSVRAANLLASFIIIPFALLIQGESIIMLWGQYEVLWWILLALLLILFILLRMGVQLFNREELLGRDLDELNLKAAWRTFAQGFVGAGRGAGIVGWYRKEVFPTVVRLRAPIAVLGLALFGAVLLGYSQAAQYPNLFVAGNFRLLEDMGEHFSQFGFFSPTGASWVFFINLRALGFASLLGMFSWGVLAIVLLMAPLALAGFIAGQMALAGVSPLLFFAVFILPHGVAEIPAALLAGGAILRLGASVIAPPPGKTLSEGWLLALADWAKI